MNRYQCFALLASLLALAAVPLSQAQDGPKAPAKGDVKTLVQGNNEFAFDLYARLRDKPGNVVFSPYSISTALGMTYPGARGNTAKQMAQTLHFTLDNERLHPAFGELIRKTQTADKKRPYQFAVANSLWGDKAGLSLNPEFLRITQSDYHAGFQLLDFRGDADSSRRTINAWVENKTNKKIQELIPDGFISKRTRLVLVNAIHYKGLWSVPLPKEATRPDDFTRPGKPAFKVPMMNHTFFTGYMGNADFQMAQLPYMDNQVSMLVILPWKMDGLAEVEKKLSARSLEQAIALLQTRELRVTLPKFTLTQGCRLSSELSELGMPDAFRPGVADFTGMETNSNRQNSLMISEVLHQAYIEVDEQGTEAAAATAVTMGRSVSAQLPPTLFRADHPFLLLLRHNETGSILFMGRVFDPRSR